MQERQKNACEHKEGQLLDGESCKKDLLRVSEIFDAGRKYTDA
jgi:hypothetical protein